MQVGSAAHPRDLSPFGEFRVDGDRIHRLASGEQVHDRVVDGLVGWAVEVGGAEDLHYLDDGFFGQQHAAEDALLGHDVVGRGPVIPHFLD